MYKISIYNIEKRHKPELYKAWFTKAKANDSILRPYYRAREELIEETYKLKWTPDGGSWTTLDEFSESIDIINPINNVPYKGIIENLPELGI